MPSPESSPRHLKSLPFGSLLGCPNGHLGGQKGPQKVAGYWGGIRQKVVPNRSPEGAPGPLPGPGWPGPARAGPAGPGAGQAGVPGLGLGLPGRLRQEPWGTLWGPIWDDILANWLFFFLITINNSICAMQGSVKKQACADVMSLNSPSFHGLRMSGCMSPDSPNLHALRRSGCMLRCRCSRAWRLDREMWSTPRWHQRKALLNSRAGYGRRLVMGGVRSQIAFGRLSAGGVVLQPASGNRQRLVTGGVWLRTASGHMRLLVAGSVLLRTASGYRPRLVTDGVWLRTASGYKRRLGFAWVRHHVIGFSQLHHMIEFSLLHWPDGMHEL